MRILFFVFFLKESLAQVNQTNQTCIKCFCLFPMSTNSTTTTTPTATTRISTTTLTPISTTSSTTISTKTSTSTLAPLIYNEVNCVFPFEMFGILYDTCTTFDDGQSYWCSLDKIYTNRAAQCKESCPQLAKNLVSDENQIHSSCLTKSSKAVGLFPLVNEIDTILKLHNQVRSSVRPSASDMKKMTWDFGLARIAQKWAENCEFSHDCSPCRRLLNNQSIPVGQNAFAIFGSEYNSKTFWTDVINYWSSEETNFEYGKGSKTGKFDDVGHYTQIIDSKTSRIGCGAAKCDSAIYAYCNYALAQDNWKIPFTSGQPCSQCSASNCANKLCNCSKLCQNNGILDPVKCECKCTTNFNGDLCQFS